MFSVQSVNAPYHILPPKKCVLKTHEIYFILGAKPQRKKSFEKLAVSAVCQILKNEKLSFCYKNNYVTETNQQLTINYFSK